MTRLSMTRGDTKSFTITLTDDDGLPLDVTGMSLIFTVKRSRFDADADAVISKEVDDGIVVDDPTTGEAVLTIEPGDTSGLAARTHRLFYDVQVVDGAGVVITPLSDILEIQPDVTQEATAPGS